MKKSVIITGAAGNLGQAITSSLVHKGYQIHATLSPNENSENIVNENVFTQTVNLLDPKESKAFILKKSIEGIDAIICIVGGFETGDIYTTTTEHINKMINLNFNTAYNVVHPLLELYKNENKPLQIIFIGSRPALNPIEGQQEIGYSLAKSLLFKLAEFINVSTNETGISASVIVPSIMDTPGTRNAMPNGDPLKWVPTDEVANTVTFILSDTGKMMRQPVYKIYNKV